MLDLHSTKTSENIDRSILSHADVYHVRSNRLNDQDDLLNLQDYKSHTHRRMENEIQ